MEVFELIFHSFGASDILPFEYILSSNYAWINTSTDMRYNRLVQLSTTTH